jgi:hypothetical protein
LPPLPPPRNASLIPHLSAIKVGLTRGLSAQRIYQDLVEDAGYLGSYDSIKRYIRKVRKKAPQFFERLPVFPGREAQVDFSHGPLIEEGSRKRRCWLFKMTLSADMLMKSWSSPRMSRPSYAAMNMRSRTSAVYRSW